MIVFVWVLWLASALTSNTVFVVLKCLLILYLNLPVDADVTLYLINVDEEPLAIKLSNVKFIASLHICFSILDEIRYSILPDVA